MSLRWFGLSVLLCTLLLFSVGCGPECPEGQTKCGETCVNTQTDNAHCGACSKACKGGEVCSAGKCATSCQEGLTLCEGQCANTKIDRTHCGACGNACKDGEVCKDGKCEISCPDKQTVCGGGCVDTQTDIAHCGKCDTACGLGEACKAGKCEVACGKDQTACGGSCVNTQTDLAHCGACDTKCEAGQVCNAGKCAANCQKDLTDCSGSCVNTQTDVAHCGACGTKCDAGQICNAGKCEASCSQGFEACGGACVNTQVSRMHCGKCDTKCEAGQICNAGKCEVSCPKDMTNCNDKCVYIEADAAHCGKCGNACKTGEVCQSGKCALLCQTGYADCGGACVNTQTTSAHCGGCGKACKAGEKCDGGKCVPQGGCPQGEVTCNNACTNTSNDPKNCGGCGKSCQSGEVCLQGTCKACTDCPYWATNMGAFNSDYVYNIAVDSKGYVYAVGSFSELARFGPFLLKSYGGTDLFVVKVSPSGSIVWARHAGGSSTDYGYGVNVSSAGNVYISGAIQSTATFGAIKLTSTGGYDIFVAKLDANGQWQWAQNYGSTSSDYGSYVGVDSNENVYITGTFYDSVKIGTTTLSSQGGSDIFVAKWDKDGQEQWAISAGSSSSDYGEALVVDGTGNTYLAGRFYSSITWGSTTLSSSGSSDVFVAKFNASGTPQWATSGGGKGIDYGYAIAVDGSGNVAVTGRFDDDGAVFGSTTLTSAGSYDIFVARLDNTGKWTWAVSAGGTDSDYGYGVGFDSTGNIFATGYFYKTATFGGTQLTPPENSTSAQIYLMQIDKTGKIVGAIQAGGTSTDIAYHLIIDKQDNIYIGGYVNALAPFGQVPVLTNGGSDGFIAKYSKPAGGVLCSTGFKICNGVCLDINTDPDNCGACGNKCTGGKLCGGGTCRECTDCPKNFLSGAASISGAYGYAYDVKADSAGNIYLAGYFYKEMSFGTTKLTSLGSADIFVAKADKTGKWLWATSFGTTTYDYAYALDVDAQGNVAVVGRFGSTGSTMNVGLSTLTSSGGSDIFVVLITAQGQPIRGASGGSSSTDYAYGVVFDRKKPGVFVGGYTYSTAKFGTLSTTAQGSADVFLGRINLQGQWTLAKNFGGSGSDYLRGLSTDQNGDLYMAGYFYSTAGASFDALTIKATSTPDAWVAKIDNNGKAVWAWAGGDTGSQYAYDVANDSKGNAFVVGYMTSSGATFGSTTLTSGGGNDIFIAKASSTGWVWAKGFGGTGSDYGYGVGVNSSDQPYIGAYFYDTLKAGPFSLTSEGSADVGLIKLDTMGNVIGIAGGGGTSSDYVNNMFVDPAGNAYLAGDTNSTEMKFSSQTYKRTTSDTPAPYVVQFGPTPCPISGAYGVCGGICADLNTNNDHCGACANKCASGKTCQAGSCK